MGLEWSGWNIGNRNRWKGMIMFNRLFFLVVGLLATLFSLIDVAIDSAS